MAFFFHKMWPSWVLYCALFRTLSNIAYMSAWHSSDEATDLEPRDSEDSGEDSLTETGVEDVINVTFVVVDVVVLDDKVDAVGVDVVVVVVLTMEDGMLGTEQLLLL